MNARCISKNSINLTYNKVYKVIDQTDDYYAIVDDSGYGWLYYKGDFEIIDEEGIIK